jgi:hypothetical protein
VDLPSTSSTRDRGETLLERHRKEKARQDKKDRKQKERLDFDFPSETARRADRRAERDKDKGRGRGQERDGEGHGDGVGAGGNEVWESGGHLNFFADLERNVGDPTTPYSSLLASVDGACVHHLASAEPWLTRRFPFSRPEMPRNLRSRTLPSGKRSRKPIRLQCTWAVRRRRPSRGMPIGI